ncbi:hypothetical protein [Flavobacterium tructae]|uniref:hypothetical protein n=1 Tax=Flavobacterium tructae TaxID=1114873 RepID=UPI0035A8BA6D
MDLFAFKINYDKQPGNSQVQTLYNGNISETYWKTNTDLTKRSYGYQYDKLNRLTNAIYSNLIAQICATIARKFFPCPQSTSTKYIKRKPQLALMINLVVF